MAGTEKQNRKRRRNAVSHIERPGIRTIMVLYPGSSPFGDASATRGNFESAAVRKLILWARS
jgi:hypothetical protein